MGTYAEFETTRDLYRGLLTTVSVASRAGGSDEAFVVKLYEPGGAVTGKAGVERESGLFLERARAMRAMTEAGAKHWLAVHALGKTDAGAFYAADRCPRTIEQLINGRVKLDGPGMFNVIRSVWEGLRELQRVKGRPHGAVKPTNVLLDRVGQVEKARVMLADPAPDTGLDHAGAELDDIRALGRLVFQLVFYQPFRERGGYPVAESAEWSKLGKKGSDWRNFCNMVLDPAVQPGQLTIEGIAGDIEALREGRSGGRGLPLVPLGVGAAAIAIVGVGGFVVVSQMIGAGEPSEGPVSPGEETVSFSEERWAQWCNAHAEFREYAISLLRERGTLEADPFLAERVLADLEEYDGRLSPHAVRGGRGSQRPVVRPEDPAPEEARTADGVRLMAEALARLDAYPRVFASDEWPARQAADALATTLRGAGLVRSASVVENWLRNASGLLVGADERAGAVLAIVRASEHAEAVAGELERFTAAAERLAASGDDRLAGALEMARHADEEIEGSASLRLAELAQRLEIQTGILAALADQIDSDEGGRVPEGFIEGSRFGEEIAELGADADAEAWERAFRGYRVELARWEAPVDLLMPSPVTDQWLAESRDTIQRARDQLQTVANELELGSESQLAAGELDSEQRSSYFEQVGTLRRRIDELEARRSEFEPKRGEVRESELPELREAFGRVSQELDGVRQQVAGIERDVMRSMIDGEAIAAELLAREGAAGVELSSVNEAFLRARDGLVAAYRDGGDAATLQSDANRLEELLRRIDSAARDATPRPAQRPSRFVEHAWNDAVRSRVDAAAAAMIAETGVGEGGVPRLDEARIRSLDALTRARGEAEEVGALIADAARLEALLDSGAPLASEPLVGELAEFGSLRESERWDEIGPALAPLAQRVDELAAIAGIDDRARLLDGASNTSDVPLAMASWRRLAELDARPAGLGDEAEALADLRQAIDLIERTQQREALAAELAEIGRSRWRGAVAAAASKRDLADTVRLAGRLGADPETAQVADRVRYNIELLRLEEASRQHAEAPGEAWVRERAGAFVSRVGSLDLGEAHREFVGQIEQIASGEEAGADFSTAGPGALDGWTAEPAGDGVVRFVSPWGRTIEFARVPGLSEADEAVYLSREEVSIGLFSEVVTRAGAWDRIVEEWTDNPVDRQRNRSVGGQNARLLSFRFDPLTGGLSPTTSWLPDFEPHFQQIQLYQQGRRPDNPTNDHPMHMVSLAAAERFVELINCRLPTDAQWRAALDHERGVGGPSANLRDASWLGQHDWVRQLDADGAFEDVPAPYPDTGIFAPPRTQVPVGSDASPAVGDDDGSVWFERVGRSGRGDRFLHMVGNVSEFIVATSLTQEHGVIGASALSPSQVDGETPYGLLPFQRRVPYADVGFRLAFTAEGGAQAESPADRLARLIDRAVYALDR